MAKALAKAPADRFTGAAAFSTALAAGAAGRRPERARRWVGRVVAGVIGLAIVGGLGLWAARSGRPDASRGRAVLRGHAQLTADGRSGPLAITADGKQFVYATRIRDPQQSPRAVEIAELDGTASRRLLDSIAWVAFIAASPNGRELLIGGVIDGREGLWLQSMLGRCAPLHSRCRRGGVLCQWRLTAADGALGARFRRVDPHRGHRCDHARQHPCRRRVGRGLRPADPRESLARRRRLACHGDELRVIDRHGREVDRRSIWLCAPGRSMRASANAIWWVDSRSSALLRLALDLALRASRDGDRHRPGREVHAVVRRER